MSARDVVAEAAEQYFQYLERDGYYPAGCSGEAAAAAILDALKANGYTIVKARDVLRALSCGPNFLDARGRILECARDAIQVFESKCPHPKTAVMDSVCWRCDQSVAAADGSTSGEGRSVDPADSVEARDN